MKRIFFLAAVVLITSANAQSTPDLNALLVGTWAQFGPGQSIERVIVFKPDRSFAMYPKCGRETEQARKAGLSVLPGTWSIVGDNTLRLGLKHADKPLNLDASIKVVGQDIQMTSANGTANTMSRYEGPLPPGCTAQP